MKTIDKLKAYSLMRGSNGRVFTAEYVKRDGTIREITCRLGVKKHLKGGTLKYNPLDKLLMVVFDMQKKEYRMINLNTLRALKINGKQFAIA